MAERMSWSPKFALRLLLTLVLVAQFGCIVEGRSISPPGAEFARVSDIHQVQGVYQNRGDGNTAEKYLSGLRWTRVTMCSVSSSLLTLSRAPSRRR